MLRPFLLIFLGLGLAGFTGKHMWDERALAERGVTTEVLPVEKYTQTTYKKGLSERREIDADLSFRTESGETITVNRRLNHELLQQLVARRPVTVRYLPENPRINRIGADEPSTASMIWVGLALAVAGGFWLRRRVNAPFEH